MILFPAIDLKDGQCVRLKKGDMNEATVFSNTPADQAALFEKQGFEWLHVVDLDGAFAGKSLNGLAVRHILEAIRIPLQLGGGIRTLGDIESWLESGVRRVILGTIAVRDPELVKQATKAFPDCIAVGIDARNGYVAVEGWAQESTLSAIELAQRFEGCGVSALIHTDIERDGVLRGLNLKATVEIARAVTIPVIASGGLADMGDIERLLAPDAALLEGAISGRALYDGRIDPFKALELIRKTKTDKNSL